MHKVVLVMHDTKHDDYYRMNKVEFEVMPRVGEFIYNTDGLAYQIEEIATFAGYVSSKGAISVLVVHQADEKAPVSSIYGMDIEQDLDD